jgi:hypothetical protein
MALESSVEKHWTLLSDVIVASGPFVVRALCGVKNKASDSYFKQTRGGQVNALTPSTIKNKVASVLKAQPLAICVIWHVVRPPGEKMPDLNKAHCCLLLFSRKPISWWSNKCHALWDPEATPHVGPFPSSAIQAILTKMPKTRCPQHEAPYRLVGRGGKNKCLPTLLSRLRELRTMDVGEALSVFETEATKQKAATKKRKRN